MKLSNLPIQAIFNHMWKPITANIEQEEKPRSAIEQCSYNIANNARRWYLKGATVEEVAKMAEGFIKDALLP